MYTATVEKEEAIIQTKKPELNANSPFINLEMLNLTLVEAFFLSFGLGCLTVTTDNNQVNCRSY